MLLCYLKTKTAISIFLVSKVLFWYHIVSLDEPIMAPLVVNVYMGFFVLL